jgi:predicted transcriptional regulator
MKKGGLTVEGVAAELRKQRGNATAVARAYGVTRQAVQRFMAGHEELRQVATECRESMKDEAESSLYKAVRKGEAWAVCFYLKCQAKDRGYVERIETREVDDDDLDDTISRAVDDLRQAEKNGVAGAHPPPPVGDRPFPLDG